MRCRRSLIVRSRSSVLPTSKRGAFCRLVEPSGRPGPGLPGFGALAGRRDFARMFLNPRRTRAGVSRPGEAGFSHGRRRSSASGRARRSWVWAVITSHVQRSPASGVRIFGRVQPRVCLNSRKVCSRSNRRRNAYQRWSMSWAVAPVREDHSQTGLGSRSRAGGRPAVGPASLRSRGGRRRGRSSRSGG